MTETANQSAPSDASAPSASRREKDSRVSMWIAMVSALSAIAAAAVAGVQVHEASQQNILSVEQQLLQLTTTIAQQVDQRTSIINQAAGSLTGSLRTSALSAAGVAWTDQLLAEGETGTVLISYLGGKGVVTSTEYTEVANALVDGEDYSQALGYYRDAVNAPPGEPLTQSDALREEGSVYYSLGEPASGHALMMQAVAVYDRSRDMPNTQIDESVGQSLADDAWFEMRARNCKIGLAEMRAATKQLVTVNGGNATDQAWISSDTTAQSQYCRPASAAPANG